MRREIAVTRAGLRAFAPRLGGSCRRRGTSRLRAGRSRRLPPLNARTMFGGPLRFGWPAKERDDAQCLSFSAPSAVRPRNLADSGPNGSVRRACPPLSCRRRARLRLAGETRLAAGWDEQALD